MSAQNSGADLDIGNHNTEKMRLSASNVESSPQSSKFESLIASVKAVCPEFQDPGPEHWRPLSLPEIINLIDHSPPAQPMNPKKMAKYLQIMVGGPAFSRVMQVAVSVPAQERMETSPSLFHPAGRLRVPWLYVLGPRIKDVREEKREEVSKPVPAKEYGRRPHNQIESDVSGTISSPSRPKGNKRLRIGKDSETPAIPETPETPSRNFQSPQSTSLSKEIRSSQSPDPLALQDHSRPVSRRKPDSSNLFTIKINPRPLVSVAATHETPMLHDPAGLARTTPIRHENNSEGNVLEGVCIRCDMANCVCSQAQPSDTRIKTPTVEQLSEQEHSPTPMKATTIQATLHGNTWLDHIDEICRPLERLGGLLSSYAGTAFRRPFRVPFLDLLCIRHEATSKDPLIIVLRDLLEIHEGVSIRSHIESLFLEQEHSIWVKAVMMALLKEFVFESDSPFEDTITLRKSLSYGGLSPDMIDMVVQDIQIRNMLAKPEEAPKFCTRKRERRDALVRKLNAVMHPLVSDNKEINGFHLEFADIATALNVNMKAYTGVYEPIYPSRGVEFDPEYHAIERPEVRGPGFNPNALKGSPILFTVVVGVRYKPVGGDWVLVAKAKVRLWEPVPPANAMIPRVADQTAHVIDDD